MQYEAGKLRKEGLEQWINLACFICKDGVNVMAEIGSGWGDSAAVFVAAHPQLKLYCIDPWANPKEDTYSGEAGFLYCTKRFMHNSNVIVMREYSVIGSRLFKEGFFDAVYIDAVHTYKNVKEDIKVWLPKIKQGGCIGGHDYGNGFSGVERAVHELLGEPITFVDYSWLIRV